MLVLFIFTANVFGQEKYEDNYLNAWADFKKVNAPFNDDKCKDIFRLSTIKESNLHLGDLNYKRQTFTLEQELIGIVLNAAVMIADYPYNKNEIWKDPSKYFLMY